MNMPPQNYGPGPGHAPPVSVAQPAPNPQVFGQPGYGQPGYGHPYGAPTPPQYEFTAAQNEVIGKVAWGAKAIGILQYISAGLQLLSSNLVGAGVGFYIGYQFHQGGTAMQRVVDTQGNDIGNLMEALDKIAGAFLIRLILVAVAFGIVLIMGLAMSSVILAALAEASQGGL